MSEPVLELRGVSRSFGAAGNVVHALRECDLVLRDGDFASVTGPSGSGKSTLMNVLGLLETPSAGEHYIDGVSVTEHSDAQRSVIRGRSIGFVFQDSRLVWHRSVLENVCIGLMYGDVPRRERRALALTALGHVGMSHRLDALPSTLSGGERQRVAIARAIARNPRIVLADEPTGNLDEANTAAVMSLLHALNKAGNTIVLVTHDLDIAARAPTRLLMSDGRLGRVAQRARA